MNYQYTKIFALIGFILGAIWSASNSPYFIGIYDIGSLAYFIGGGIPLCLIASIVGLIIDKNTKQIGVTHKKCNACSELILIDAIKCKHCGSVVNIENQYE